MYARKVSKGLLGDCLSSLHVKLAEAVDAAVGSAVSGGQMIRLSAVVDTFGADFLTQYRDRLRPEHRRALAAMQHCRTQSEPEDAGQMHGL